MVPVGWRPSAVAAGVAVPAVAVAVIALLSAGPPGVAAQSSRRPHTAAVQSSNRAHTAAAHVSVLAVPQTHSVDTHSPMTSLLASYLPMAMRRARLANIPRVKPVSATATPATSLTPSATPTMPAPHTDVPPSLTPTHEPPTPTDVPASPSPTTSATPGGLVCQDLLQNGGFESGAVQWSVAINGARQPPSDAIQPRGQSAVPPRTGEWAAWIGGLLQGLSVLESTGLVTYEPQTIVSATLKYHVALITEETPNHRDNDWVRARLDGERRNLQVDGSARSEEAFAAQRTWQAVVLDVTDYLATDQVRRISLEVENDMLARSWFYFDDVAVTACWAMP